MTIAGCALGHRPEPARSEVLARILPSAVQVVLEQEEGQRVRTGSGVVIGARSTAGATDCFVLTSGHVVSGLEGRARVHVLFGRDRGPGTKHPADVMADRAPTAADLALLRVETDRCVPARVGPPAVLGESVWVVSFPWGRSMTLGSGIVSQVSFGENADPEMGSRLMVDALVSYGTSGSGVFAVRTGHLLGLVEGYRTARLTAQGGTPPWYVDIPVPGQTFVTAAADIRRFLDALGYPDLVRAPAGRP